MVGPVSSLESGVRSSPRLSQIQQLKAARRAEMAAASKFSEQESDDNREGKARAPTGEFHNCAVPTKASKCSSPLFSTLCSLRITFGFESFFLSCCGAKHNFFRFVPLKSALPGGTVKNIL